MNREIICSLLSAYVGIVSTPVHANDNPVVAECTTGTVALGHADYYIDRSVIGAPRARRLRSRPNILVPAVSRTLRPLPAIRLLIARPR
jgi:hypothetical protein